MMTVPLSTIDGTHQQISFQGFINPATKFPTVRDLALDAAVNPNTMQKALSELERSGLVYSQRTSGRFITRKMKLCSKK